MYHAVVVANRRAGAGAEQVDAHARRLLSRIRADASRSEYIDFAAGATASRRGTVPAWKASLQRLLHEGVDRVFVLGGDGTVLAVASLMLGGTAALGIVPLGTANLLARDLSIPLLPDAAVDALAGGTAAPRVLRIDVGRVNGEPFLCASMLGMTTTLARVREEARGSGALRLGGRMAVETLRLLRNYPSKRVRLSAHGETLNFRTRALVVSNNPVLADLRPVPRRPRLDTGELGVYGVRAGPLYEWPRLVWRLLSGSWPEDPRLFHYRTSSLALDTWGHHKVTVLNDGERLRLKTPLRYELLPRALAVLAPAAVEPRGRADGAPGVDATTVEPGRAPDPHPGPRRSDAIINWNSTSKAGGMRTTRRWISGVMP